jgi:hypothetical protein
VAEVGADPAGADDAGEDDDEVDAAGDVGEPGWFVG